MKVAVFSSNIEGGDPRKVCADAVFGWKQAAPGDEVVPFVGGPRGTQIALGLQALGWEEGPAFAVEDCMGNLVSVPSLRSGRKIYIDCAGVANPRSAGHEEAFRSGPGSKGIGLALVHALELTPEQLYVALGPACAVDLGRAAFEELAKAGYERLPVPVTVLTEDGRPLLGLSGTARDFRGEHRSEALRLQKRVKEGAAFLRSLEEHSLQQAVLISAVGTAEGSGSGAGAAEVLRLMGAKLARATSWLANLQDIPTVLNGCDLAVVFEDEIHSQVLASSLSAYVGQAGQEAAIPTVMVPQKCSLSRPEVAHFGINAIFSHPELSASEVGLRLARTWSHP